MNLKTILLAFAFISLSQAALAQLLDPSTTYGNELGCMQAAGGDGSDGWRTLNSEGLAGHEKYCEFINLNVGSSGSYLATALCSGEGYTFPEIFSISPSWDSKSMIVVEVGEDYAEGEVYDRCEAQ